MNNDDVLLYLNLEQHRLLMGKRQNIKTTQCEGRGGRIPKTEYVYTEFPPWRRWHSDMDPQGANTKTTVFSVSKNPLPGIDDHHQQHQYLRTSSSSPSHLPGYFLCDIVYSQIHSGVTRQTWKIKMSFLCCKNISCHEGEMKRSINYDCHSSKVKEYFSYSICHSV